MGLDSLMPMARSQTRGVIWDESLRLFVPQFLHLYMGYN